MRLFEAIIDANHRAVAGDKEAGLHPADFENELPVIALTCIDPRLNAFFPNALALPADQFIWLRNAGNIIFDPMSSMMRTLALACAVKGGKEIAIIGHTDCQVAKTTTMRLLERFKELGVERHLLPENLIEFFGLFSSERQNVIKSCDIVRHSPLIGPRIPVHGLLLNIETGELDWVVNGYQALDTLASRLHEPISPAGATPDLMKSLSPFHLGEMKFPEGKIGELATKAEDWLSKQAAKIGTPAREAVREVAPVAESVERAAQQVTQYAEKHWPKPPKIPIPPPIRPVKRR
ncbi:MAG TPA: carbonic anhydrase [Candidatus Limnocylindrales bacterium]|nr:carbonic anhydrase [Candidatus Limnocylindrales bacterium]